MNLSKHSFPNAPVEGDTRPALAATAAEGLRPISAGLVFLYAYYSVDNLLVLPSHAAGPTSAVAFVTMVVLLLFHLRLRRKPLPDRWAHAATAGMAGFILLNSLVYMGYMFVPYRTINLALLIIGAGCCMLSREWFVLTVIAALVSWEVVACALEPPRVGIHFDYTLFKATVLASIVHVVRVRTHRRLEGLRAREASAREKLEKALVVVDEARQAAVASNRELERAMEEVRQSEARACRTSRALETVIEACPLPIFTLHPPDGVQRWNSAAARQLGWPQVGAGRAGRPALPEELMRVCGTLFLQDARERTLTGEEVRCRAQGGVLVDFRVFAAPLQEGEAAVGGIVVLLDDITERKRLEAAAREEHLRSLMANASDIVLLTDRKGTIRYVGPSIERALGYTQADLLAADPTAWIHPDDREEVERTFARLIATPGGALQCEHRVRHREGSWRVMETLGTNRLDDPGVSGVVFNLRDITERTLAEEAFRQSEERLRFALEAAGIGIWQWDLQTGRIHWSSVLEELCGQPAGSFGGTFDACMEIIHPEDRQLLETEIETALQRGGEYYLQHRIIRRDGTVRWVVSKGRYFRDGSGSVTRMAGITMDVTAQRQLEEEVRQAQKMEAIGRLAGGVAHDFNNMLNVIIGYSELLIAQSGPGNLTRDSLEEIRTAAGRAATLTHQLLAFGRRQFFTLKVLDLNGIIAGMERMLQPLFGEDIEFETIPAPDLWTVRADPGQIEQILMNLAVNARDAMPRGGRLTIETANVDWSEEFAMRPPEVGPGCYAMISISDTGTGMDEKTLSQIFEPFFTTKGFGEGTGLGLSTVYGIVCQSGGHITVSSRVGSGTTFRIYLPRTSPVSAAVCTPV